MSSASGTERPSGPQASRTWFDVARAVGDTLVPGRADWVVLHVRSSVLVLMRSGRSASLQAAGLGEPVEGESLSLVTLRHGDADLEVALHRLVLALAPKVGDAYGSGRVTATGRSRLASRVDPAHLRAIASDEANLHMLERLDLGSAVIAPVVADGVVIGAVNLVRSQGGVVDQEELRTAEDLGLRIGAALEGARPGTAARLPRAPRPDEVLRWDPPDEGNPIAALRTWVRRMLPEMVDRRVRDDLAEDLDLTVSELAGNALRHTGAVSSAVLERHDDVVRVKVSDADDRVPTARLPGPESEGGRGLMLVEAISEAWGVEHDLEQGGKSVWAEFGL